MMQLDSSQKTAKKMTRIRATSISSKVSPWLISLLHPLARYVVLPTYFESVWVTGQENLPKTGPAILAPTHRSRWDPILISHLAGRSVTGRDLHFMTTATEMKGIQGWFVRRLGGFPVDLSHPGIGSLRHGIELLNEGKMVTIFPEGGIFHKETVPRLKPGLARLALNAESAQPGLNIHIVPVSIHYSTLKAKLGCDVRVNIGAPISVGSYLQDSVKQGAKQLTADLHNTLEDLYEACGEFNSSDLLHCKNPSGSY
ncbi:MAG: 1-acyl-sn-glycerol-3-phosphate acyltransferase [Geitlerinemataceae cyanobacterium]